MMNKKFSIYFLLLFSFHVVTQNAVMLGHRGRTKFQVLVIRIITFIIFKKKWHTPSCFGLFVLLFCTSFTLFSQDNDTINKSLQEVSPNPGNVVLDRVSVFVDCASCDNSFIRQQTSFVNHVRDPKLAEIHVFITSQGTASGGETFTLSFIGQKRFKGINNTLTYISTQNNTRDEDRKGLAEMIKLGLIPYIAHTSMANSINVNVDDQSKIIKPQNDPWNNWIFEIYGGVNFAKESRRGSLDLRYGFYADYVTESWRIRLRPFFNYNQETYVKDGEDVRSVLHRDGFEGKVVRSISDHWSLGAFTEVNSNSYENIDIGYRIAPAIEYSLLPYKLALRKEFTIAYSVGYQYRDYMEETIFGKLQETLYDQSLKLAVRVLQPWGTVRAGLEGSHFLHDLSKNRISFDSSLSVRVFKGLSFNFSCDYDYVQDQLSLPKGDASLEEVLLGQRQLATSFGISLSAGFSYSFGSIYNNIVNTRL